MARRAIFAGGRGFAVYVSGGTIYLREVGVNGYEVAFQADGKSLIDVADFSSVRADRSAVSLNGVAGRLADVLVVDSGVLGGVHIVDSDVSIDRVIIHRPLVAGIWANKGRLKLSDATIAHVTGEKERVDVDRSGNGVRLDQVEARLERLVVTHADGAGLVASTETTVVLLDSLVDNCRRGGVVAERGAQVDVVSLLVRESESAAVIAPDTVSLHVDLLTSEKNAAGPVWAECSQGASVGLTRMKSDVAFRPGICVVVE